MSVPIEGAKGQADRPCDRASMAPTSAPTNEEDRQTAETTTEIRKGEHSKATNRDRYENKPMPELPPEASGLLISPPRQQRIQPAIPLVTPKAKQAKRAVTAPVEPASFQISRKPSVSQLRKVFGHAKRPSKDEWSKTPVIPPTSRKAAIILGLPPQSDEDILLQSTGSESRDDVSEKDPSQSRKESCLSIGAGKAYDETVYCKDEGDTSDEKAPKTPAVCISTDALKADGLGDKIDSARVPEHGSAIETFLSPCVAKHGQVGDKISFHKQRLCRVESVQGIIENAELMPECVNNRDRSTSRSQEGHNRQIQVAKGQETLVTPVKYEGVWENDPAVGYSLPPFSPYPKVNCETPLHINRGQKKAAMSPSIYDETGSPQSVQPLDSVRSTRDSHDLYSSVTGFNPEPTTAPRFIDVNRSFLAGHQLPSPLDPQPRLGSGNSWARPSSSNEPLSALLPPRWPDQGVNSVPPPQMNQPDHAHTEILVAGLSKLDRTIHHHLDSGFNSLAHHVSDRHNKVLDQVLRNLDDMGEAVARNHKAITNELKCIRDSIQKLQSTSTQASVDSHTTREQVKILESSIVNMSKRLDDQLGWPHGRAALTDERQHHSVMHKRAESTHGQRAIASNGISLAAEEHTENGSKARHSKTSGRSHRSNASNEKIILKPSDSGKSSDHRSGPPDIRNHPAFSDVGHEPQPFTGQYGNQVSNATTYGSQGLGYHGWYQQAYGSF